MFKISVPQRFLRGVNKPLYIALCLYCGEAVAEVSFYFKRLLLRELLFSFIFTLWNPTTIKHRIIAFLSRTTHILSNYIHSHVLCKLVPPTLLLTRFPLKRHWLSFFFFLTQNFQCCNLIFNKCTSLWRSQAHFAFISWISVNNTSQHYITKNTWKFLLTSLNHIYLSHQSVFHVQLCTVPR
jgi:hypothetical protein